MVLLHVSSVRTIPNRAAMWTVYEWKRSWRVLWEHYTSLLERHTTEQLSEDSTVFHCLCRSGVNSYSHISGRGGVNGSVTHPRPQDTQLKSENPENDVFFFWPRDLDLWPMTLTSKFVRDIIDVKPCTKFVDHMLNGSAVRVLTDTNTDTQTAPFL